MQAAQKQILQMTKEADVARPIKQALRYSGWLVMRNKESFGSYPGYSDFTIVKDGRVIFLEIKRPKGGYQGKKQIEFQKDIESHGAEYRIAKDIDDIYDLLEGIIKF